MPHFPELPVVNVGTGNKKEVNSLGVGCLLLAAVSP